MVHPSYALAPLLLLLAATVGSAATATSAVTDEIVSIENEGSVGEGHTPTAFAGMGTGLFAGDNLNPGFPEGVGVQTYLSFGLPAELDMASASLVSDDLHVSGTPFEDLGPLVAEPVAYEVFGPDVFDTPALGPHSECTVVDGISVHCDVTEALRVALDEGRTVAQFRVRFTSPADNDSQQDLALFYRTDSNTNEVGLFRLEVAQNT